VPYASSPQTPGAVVRLVAVQAAKLAVLAPITAINIKATNKLVFFTNPPRFVIGTFFGICADCAAEPKFTVLPCIANARGSQLRAVLLTLRDRKSRRKNLHTAAKNHAPSANTRSSSGQVVAIKVHHLVPRSHEVLHKRPFASSHA